MPKYRRFYLTIEFSHHLEANTRHPETGAQQTPRTDVEKKGQTPFPWKWGLTLFLFSV